jgi:hypothetical protein
MGSGMKTLGSGMETLDCQIANLPTHHSLESRCFVQTPRLTLIFHDRMHDLSHYVTCESYASNLPTVAFNWLIELKS